MTRTLSDFTGGLKLAGLKSLSNGTPTIRLPLPPRLILPLQQHIGQMPEPLVQVGESVFKGQLLAQSRSYVSAALHAPTSGTIQAIAPFPSAHPSGLPQLAIELIPDGRDAWSDPLPLPPILDYLKLPVAEIRQRVAAAGIVGLGGAGFPTHVKLNTGQRTAVGTLILNGAECEPLITCDDRLMREAAAEVISGARMMRHALHAVRCVIAVEDNKPEAIKALKVALELSGRIDIEIVAVPTRYPAGGEKQLIKTLTGQEVPSQGIPIDINVVCQNVGTAVAVCRAVKGGEPLLRRIVTVSGEAVARPQNFEVFIGTPIRTLIEAAGGATCSDYDLLIGGPMMGVKITDESLPITKTSNAILLRPAQPARPHQPCIRCGECVTVCPAKLLPQQLYWHARGREFDKVQDFGLFDCIECGCCAWVCPSKIPLVHYYRFAKTEIWEQDRLKKSADVARERHEFRQFRLQREKEERAARHQQAAKVAQATTPAADDKQALIAAALARAEAKKQAKLTATDPPSTTEEPLPPCQS